MINSNNIESYKILHFSSGEDLEEEVNNLIKKGWQPYGEMKFSPENETYSKSLYQQMVKYSKI